MKDGAVKSQVPRAEPRAPSPLLPLNPARVDPAAAGARWSAGCGIKQPRDSVVRVELCPFLYPHGHPQPGGCGHLDQHVQCEGIYSAVD